MNYGEMLKKNINEYNTRLRNNIACHLDDGVSRLFTAIDAGNHIVQLYINCNVGTVFLRFDDNHDLWKKHVVDVLNENGLYVFECNTLNDANSVLVNRNRYVFDVKTRA